MPSEELRTLVAFIRDVTFIAVLLIALLLALLLFRQVSKLVGSVRRVMDEAEEMVTTVSDRIVRPASAGSGVAFGAGKVLAFLSGFRRRNRRRNKRRDG